MFCHGAWKKISPRTTNQFFNAAILLRLSLGEEESRGSKPSSFWRKANYRKKDPDLFGSTGGFEPQSGGDVTRRPNIYLALWTN